MDFGQETVAETKCICDKSKGKVYFSLKNKDSERNNSWQETKTERDRICDKKKETYIQIGLAERKSV